VYQCFALRVGALCSSEDGRFGGARDGRGFSPASCSPCASILAFVCVFRTVVETVGVFAGFATKREEVELVAVCVVAVRANGFEIFVPHHCESLIVGSCWSGRGRHVGGLDLYLRPFVPPSSGKM
jgi:hypothetical protein